MISFAEATLAVAMRRLDNALAKLEQHADAHDPKLVGDAYRELLALRGLMHAVAQLEQIAADIGTQDTERPAPRLTLVGKEHSNGK